MSSICTACQRAFKSPAGLRVHQRSCKELAKDTLLECPFGCATPHRASEVEEQGNFPCQIVQEEDDKSSFFASEKTPSASDDDVQQDADVESVLGEIEEPVSPEEEPVPVEPITCGFVSEKPMSHEIACGSEDPCFAEVEAQTDVILTAVEERAGFQTEPTVQLVGEYNDGILTEGAEVWDMHVSGSFLRWLDSNGKAFRQDLSTLRHLITDRLTPLGDDDNRAQKLSTKWVGAREYTQSTDHIDLRGG